jgi:hypothetical protein
MIRQSVLKLAPLLGRIRQIKFGSLADWLKQDPIRDYRHWYRYSRPGKDADRAGRPNFEQTLARVLRSRSGGSLSTPAVPEREKTFTPSGDMPGTGRDQLPDRDRIGGIDPVTHSRKQ